MIDIEKLKAVTTLVCHANCPDGLASAIILHQVLPNAKVVFVQYNTPELTALQAVPGMLFCDFAPPADRVEEFLNVGTIVLDHHKSAKGVVAAFGANGVFADEKDDPGVSGALLAFREVWMPIDRAIDGSMGTFRSKRVEQLATLAGIRDTWQRKAPEWNAACAQAEALLFWPAQMWLDARIQDWDDLIEIGPTLITRHADHVDRSIKEAYRFTLDSGMRVLMFQGTGTTSDAAEKLGDTVDLVVGFKYAYDNEGLKIVFSTRSHTNFDCAKFAKKHPGGGGHTGAAGFAWRIPVSPGATPYALFRNLLEVYLSDE